MTRSCGAPAPRGHLRATRVARETSARRDGGASADAALPFSLPQALILCFVNLNEACAGNIIWPLLPFFVARFALAEDVGIYTGLLASAFFAGQACVV